jgi:methyl-accepting chemotaxis protein
MKRVSLKFRLIASFLLTGLLPLIFLGFYSFKISEENLEKEAFSKLTAVRNIKGKAVERYFDSIRDQALTLSHDVMIVDAMKAFRSEFKTFRKENSVSKADILFYKSELKKFYVNEFGKKFEAENEEASEGPSFFSQLTDDEIALQYHYIVANENALGSKDGLDFASDKSKYSKTHEKYHPSIREFLQKFGYYDIFLVDIDSGNIVYSVFKELDYATSLANGPYSRTNFAEAFRKAKEIEDKQSFALVDYEKYAPSYNAPASFIGVPIWNGNEKVGVVMLQMPIDRLNAIMGQRDGMGTSGETYLIGQDKLLRSDSSVNTETYNVINSFKNPSSASINSSVSDAVLSGKSDNLISTNYKGEEVIAAYSPINILGLKWGLIAEVGKAEAFAPIEKLKNTLGIVLVVSVVLISLFSFYLSNSLSKKITQIAEKLIYNSNEVRSSSVQISQSSSELSEASTEAASSLQETVSSIDEISSMVQRNADAAASSSKVSEKSSQAAMRGKETVDNMLSSISDISQSNEEIADEMKRNNHEVSKIVDVISQIGEKTKVINDIVFQTKLLSFNASVEAARAGKHGKGFAVVAEEVGNLASMSGKAAKEITDMLESSIHQVTDIVENTKQNVEGLVSKSKAKVEYGNKVANDCSESLDEILQNVTTVNEMVREIATASNEQSTGVREVTSAIQQLDQTTHQNTNVAQKSSVMATTLRGQADGLNSAVAELMDLVSPGENSKGSTGSVPESSGSVDRTNVVELVQKDRTYERDGQEVRVAGLDTVIPSGSDDRFEDL